MFTFRYQGFEFWTHTASILWQRATCGRMSTRIGDGMREHCPVDFVQSTSCEGCSCEC